MEINDIDMIAINYRCTLSVCGQGDVVNGDESVCKMKDGVPRTGKE